MTMHPTWCPDISEGQFNLVRWNNKVMVYKINDEGTGVHLDCELEHDGDICDISFCHHGKFLLVGTKKDVYTVWWFPERRKIKDIKGVSLSMQFT